MNVKDMVRHMVKLGYSDKLIRDVTGLTVRGLKTVKESLNNPIDDHFV